MNRNLTTTEAELQAPLTDAHIASHSMPGRSMEVELVVEAGKTAGQYWRDLWRYRELFYFLAWRDVKVRYKQTTLGIAWALIRPLLTMIIFVVIFGKLANLKSPSEVPYTLLVMAGMLPWQFFAGAMSECGSSLLANASLISKVYFPRLITPAAVVIVSFVDFVISGVLMLGLMAWYQFAPPLQALLLPVYLLLALAAALGGGLWLSALTVKYRDFRYIVPFIVQFGLYVSPVGFSSEVVPESWRLLYAVNPLVGIIEGFRWSLLGTPNLTWLEQMVSSLVTGMLLISGFWYFRSTEREFADTI